MDRQYRALTLLSVVVLVFAGCASTSGPPSDATLLPLNEGVKDLSFLSRGERELLETANRTRGEGTAPGTPKPLKVSRGLSQAAKARAEELAGTGPGLRHEGSARLLERLGTYGSPRGRVAEIVSHGYSAGGRVMAGFMGGNTAEAEESRTHLLDPSLTVAGVGCAPAGHPGPVCVVDFAAEFEEVRQ